MAKPLGPRLVQAARLHRQRTGHHLAALGLFPGQETVLAALLAEDGRTMGSLAKALRVRAPTASKTVLRLTAEGLVARQGASEGDGRLKRVFLTEAGRAKARLVAAVEARVEAEIAGALRGKQRRALAKLLKALARHLAALDGAPAAVAAGAFIDEPGEDAVGPSEPSRDAPEARDPALEARDPAPEPASPA